MFRSLRSFNYRAWFIGSVVSNIGIWMQTTAQSWLVLTELTSGDAAALGRVLVLQFGAPVLLAPWSGWVTDRFDRRRLLLLTQTCFMFLATTLGILVVTGAAEMWHVYALSAGLGVVAAVDAPARHAIVTELVGREDAANAVALNTATFSVARLVGPAVAGFTIVAVGSGWVFLANALTFPATIVAILAMRTHELLPHKRANDSEGMSGGFRYVAHRSDLLVVFGVIFLVTSFATNFPLFAATMAVDFGLNADGFGLLTSAIAVGALVGALFAASRRVASVRVMIAASGIYGVAATLCAFMPSYIAFGFLLPFVGLGATMTLATANGYVQTNTASHVRGRVLALYLAVVMGGTPIGGFFAGWVASTWGPRPSLVLAGVVGLIGCSVAIVWLAANRPRPRF